MSLPKIANDIEKASAGVVNVAGRSLRCSRIYLSPEDFLARLKAPDFARGIYKETSKYVITYFYVTPQPTVAYITDIALPLKWHQRFEIQLAIICGSCTTFGLLLSFLIHCL